MRRIKLIDSRICMYVCIYIYIYMLIQADSNASCMTKCSKFAKRKDRKHKF